MSSSDQCTVALVDPIWVGHHATYFRAFIESFLEVGARVVALALFPGSGTEWPMRAGLVEFEWRAFLSTRWV